MAQLLAFPRSHQSCPPARDPGGIRCWMSGRSSESHTHPDIRCCLEHPRDKSLLPSSPSLLFPVYGLDFSSEKMLPQGMKPHLWIRLSLASPQCPGFGKLSGPNQSHISLGLSSWVNFPSIPARLLMFLAATTAVVWMKAPCWGRFM